MNIVVLDGYTLNPGDMDWSPIKAFGNLNVFDRTPVEEVGKIARHADILLTNKAKVTADAISQIPNLKYIGELATGFDNIDIVAARKRGIPVCNVPGYSTNSVAQLAWAYILEITYHIQSRSDSVHRGDWSNQPDFCYGHGSLVELAGKTLGVIGLGKIGMAVAQIAIAFGMRVIATVRDPSRYSAPGIQFVSLNECFSTADFISLHCPLTDSTREMVNANLLSLMKPSAYLINTSRGALIKEQDLADALKSNKIAGAAIDVLSKEPPPIENPLLTAPRCIITPHIAWSTKESRRRLLDISAENIRAFLNGIPQNVVN
ncbi:MAG: glycerate dehydrogenase [Bacteroidetes bacterium]|nr:MAG: glycerate dehydrogenase [Bacteroidota bacterium]